MFVASTNNIRARRKRLGLSAEAVAQRAGLAASTVRLAEAGWRPNGGSAIQRIDRVLREAT